MEGGRHLADRTKSRSSKKPPSPSRRELTARLREAEETLRAIRSGEVDAIVVAGPRGEKVFTLEGADHIYRVFVERMNEGAAVLSRDHTILHCNGRFARLLGAALRSVIGSSLQGLVWPDDRASLDALLRRAARAPCRGEIRLQSQGAPLPVHVSLSPLRPGGTRAVCLIASDLTDVRGVEQELRASSEQLRNLAARLLSVREEERTRIAREIHDELGQSLTTMKLDISWLARRLSPRNGQMLQRIRATLRLADDLIKSVRRISTDLRPGILDLGLSAAVEWQAQEFQARTGIPCKLRLLAEEVVVAPDVSTALFRILQETLTNVARHARATRTEVVLERQREGLALSIRDDGRGFDPVDPSLSKSLGLLGIRERAAMLGGRVSISSTPGKGTRITAWIPLASSQESPATP